jgi:hypothetical protein
VIAIILRPGSAYTPVIAALLAFFALPIAGNDPSLQQFLSVPLVALREYAS